MKAFLDSIIEYLNAPAPIHRPIKVGRLGSEASGMAIVLIPSGPGERYMSGRTDRVQFQLLTKDRSQAAAIDKISAAAAKLTNVGRGAIPAVDGSFELITCDLNTSPRYVETTSNQEYIYTALFAAEIEPKPAPFVAELTKTGGI